MRYVVDIFVRRKPTHNRNHNTFVVICAESAADPRHGQRPQGRKLLRFSGDVFSAGAGGLDEGDRRSCDQSAARGRRRGRVPVRQGLAGSHIGEC